MQVLPITETRFKRKRDTNQEGTPAPKSRASSKVTNSSANPRASASTSPALTNQRQHQQLQQQQQQQLQASLKSAPLPPMPSMLSSSAPSISVAHTFPPPLPASAPYQQTSFQHQSQQPAYYPQQQQQQQQQQAPTLPGLSTQLGNGTSPRRQASLPAFSPKDLNTTPQAEPRLFGSTSLSHLLHSTSTLPIEHLKGYDDKHAQRFEVKNTGDGFIRVTSGNSNPHPETAAKCEAPPGLQAELVEQLVNRYFEGPGMRFPVISRADFLHSGSLTPLLLYTICGVAALAHDVPSNILRTIKQLIAHAMRDDEAMSRSSLQTIQGLLLYSYAFELERGAAASRTWFCLGMAVRMAQDIGLHRETPGTSLYDLEQRRRIWAGCILTDRWMSAR
jgi:hypothetical protein